MSNSLVFKNHHLHHYFQKLIKLSFFKTHRFMFQTRGIRPCFIHFLRFQKTKDHHLKKKIKKKKIIIVKISKNHAFILN